MGVGSRTPGGGGFGVSAGVGSIISEGVSAGGEVVDVRSRTSGGGSAGNIVTHTEVMVISSPESLLRGRSGNRL